MISAQNNVCRLCGESSETFALIFDNVGPLNFAEKIKSYLHVEIEHAVGERNQAKICNVCIDKIIGWDEYAEHVRRVQEMFTSRKENFTNEKEHKKNAANKNSVIKEPEPVSCDVSQVENNLPERERSKGKSKHKSGKKRKRKKASVESNVESDFSDEDNIPLANHLDTVTEALKNRLNKKVDWDGSRPQDKPPKERIKDCREDKEDLMKIEKNHENGECNDDDEEDDNDDDGDGSKSRDKNGINTGELQPLFVWQCLKCQKPLKNWNALVKHCKEIHNSNASVQCVCGKILQSRASIMKHRTKHTIGYEYKCQFENCNKTFHRQQLLDVHSLSHMPKELQPWMCCKCSRRFHSESLLKQHEKVHLPKEEKLIHPCEVCQKKFCSKSAVSAHIRAIHFGERPFVCDQCGHSFTSKGILHEHMTIHSDVYNFHCKDCNKSFKTKYRLKIHMDTHVETRYECPICSLTLNTRRTLRMHLLVHKDDKAFQCTTCGKAFKRSKDLKNHYNLHTGRRPYVCPFCHRTFANGSNCRSHKRRMHPEELKMYEAALAAGQQPVILHVDNAENEGTVIISRAQAHEDESNESKSDVSDVKFDVSKSLENDKSENATDTTNATATGTGNGKQSTDVDGPAPVKLEANTATGACDDNRTGSGETNQAGVKSVEVNATEHIVTNFTQITFSNQPQNLQCPLHHFYTVQSSGVPAFPGNPFLRQ